MQIDVALIKACSEGDSRAQHALYRQAFPYLIKICYRYTSCKDDAVDMLNQGFLKIFQALPTYREEQPFLAWAKRIVINAIIDNFRRNKNYREQIQIQEEYYQQQDHSDFNAGEMRMMSNDLMNLVQQLPPMSREVLNLNVIDGYAHKEIAQMLGISESASKWHLFSARNKLREWLEMYNPQKQSTHVR